MKKLTLIVALAALATSCNSKPGVNHGVVKLEHETATAEEMHHKTHAAEEAHEGHSKEAKHEEKAETKDSTKTVETHVTEKKDSVAKK